MERATALDGGLGDAYAARVEPIVDLAPGTERNELARAIAERLRDNLAGSMKKQRAFRRLRGALYMVENHPLPALSEPDQAPRSGFMTGVGEALTLRFDFGRLTIHDGLVGVPDVTIRADRAMLALLSGGPAAQPASATEEPISLAMLARAYRGGALKVYGLMANWRFLSGILKLLERGGAS